MSVELRLICDGCGATDEPPIPFKLSRLGGVRMHVGSLWYIDGATVHCNACRTEREGNYIHSQTWEEIDLQRAAGILGIKIKRVRECTERWEVVGLD